jgi:hypothetical protein
VWGREASRGALDTAGGPSWKPLPVLATTPLALAGGAAPALWLVVARAGGVLALAGAHRLAGRLAGPAAAWTAVAAMAFSEWWLFNTALGNSEGLLAAAVLWAVVAHLAGHRAGALALGVAVGLLRPEAWPFLGPYAVWLWSRRAAPRPVILAALAAVPLLWLGLDLAGSGGALGAADAARGTASPGSAAYADVPAWQVLVDFAELLTLPVAAAAVLGAALGGPIARVLAAGSVAWVAMVAAMAQAGFAGNPRYNVAPAAVCCVLAGVGAALTARRLLARAKRSADEGTAGGGSATSAGEGRATTSAAATSAGAARGATSARATTSAGAARGAKAAGATTSAGDARGATSGGAAFATAPAIGGLVLAAAVLAFTAGTLLDQAREVGERAQRAEDLDALVARAGGAAAVRDCGPPRTVQPMRALLAWRLDVPMAHLTNRPRPPVAVFRAPAGYGEEPAGPSAPPGAAIVAAAGDWTLLAACAGGRKLRPAAAGSGS